MAQRRMFSPKIVDSDAFLDMPTSSRELYFQLGMRADDDGFVSPRGVMRSIGASGDDLKMLVAKRFVIPFDNGVVVIKHWKINNLVRKDWYQPTLYVEQMRLLKLKDNGAYTFVNGLEETALLSRETESVNNSLTQVRLGKVNKNNTSRSQKFAGTKKKMQTYNEEDPYEEKAIDLDTREEITTEKKSTVGASMKSLLNWGIERRGGPFVNNLKQFTAFKKARTANITPARLQGRWVELEAEEFWRKKGFDWMDVVNTFDKRV